MKRTLEQILNETKRIEKGMYGVNECKESIEMRQRYEKKTLNELLEEYVERANKDMFFNTQMVLACWEMINEQ